MFANLLAQIKHLQAERGDLERQVENFTQRRADAVRSAAESRQEEEERHQQEVEKLKTVNEHLKEKLEALLSAPKK